MTTILTLVDFSDASANAVSFAAELSKRSSARLVISNILQKDVDEEETKDRLKSIESDLKKSFDINCETFLAHGSLITTLKKIIAVQRPDMIVMGTKGASGLKKMLIGSNTVNVISKIKVPVLVIPEVARFENFLKKGKDRIVLATDLDELENQTGLDILKEIALLIIEPKIRVLSVRPKNTSLSDSKRMERDLLLFMFKPEVETERVTIFSKSVIGGINYYLNMNNDTGMIAMIARDSGHLFQKHYTREMASHSHLPLLVLYDAKI
ncbi:MAG TPA: universal stress protein [Puia sp.]|jgi:nucleotide-binding universal stress UspA family protein